MSSESPHKPLVLMILDGWGCREDAPDNAISQAQTPTWDDLWANARHCTLETSGEAVGLPAGQMGNSEVGHMNIGAGRIVFQDFTRISNAIADGSFFSNDVLCHALSTATKLDRAVHIMGLLSPGGVHSHEDHLLATLELAERRGAKRIFLHAFLDGRDTPPRSAGPSIRRMQRRLDEIEQASFGVLSGRYYAMDRDHRWHRVERAWTALALGRSPLEANTASQALEDAYEREEGDEFVQPTVIGDYPGMADGDAVIFVNFRADRAREMTQAFVQPSFDGFDRKAPKLSAFVCMTEYLEGLPVGVAFPPEPLPRLLGALLAESGLRQLRIAETEKYAHVTFFFNGGEEKPFPREDRVLVPSPNVATYDLQPEMSAPEVAERLVQAIRSRQYDVIICNLADPDMVGHTGSLEAAIAAVEAVDQCLGIVRGAISETGGELLITADHGNVEQMSDPETGQMHTAHTTNPVPFIFEGRDADIASSGSLRDIAPTMLQLLGLAQPKEMTGRPLLQLSGKSAARPEQAQVMRQPLFRASLVSLLLLCGSSRAEDFDLAREDAETRLAGLREEIAALQDELASSREHYRDEQTQLKAMDLSIQSTALETRRIESDITAKESELESLHEERTDYLAALGKRRAALREQIIAAYRMGRDSRLKLLLNQDDPAKIGRMLAYYDYLSEAQARKIAELRTALQTLDRLQAGIDQALRELRAVRQRHAAVLQQLQDERENRQNLLGQLRDRIDSDQARLLELTRNQADLEALISRLARGLADIPADLGQYQHPRARRGDLPMPLQGPVLHAFGQERAGGLNWQGWLIQADSGADVKAIAYGRVAYADWLRGYGLLIIIDHGNGFMSLYGNNESLLFEPGDWVQPGESIGTVGSDPGVGQGLYFELRSNGEAIDPAAWISRRRPGA